MAERIYRLMVLLAFMVFLLGIVRLTDEAPFGTDITGHPIEVDRSQYLLRGLGAALPLFALLAGSYLFRGKFFDRSKKGAD